MPCPVRRQRLVLAAMLLLLGWAFTAQPAVAQFKCFPSCSSADARFLVIASGTDLVTLSEETLEVQFAVPAGQSSFTLGVFDGDGGEQGGDGVRHWDLGEDVPYSFTLYADPLRDGSGTTIVEMSPGAPVTFSSTMPNNDWIDYAIPTDLIAQAPSGNYFYRLEIKLLDNSGASYNAFKLRTDGIVSIRLSDQPFSYIASLGTFEEAQIIYPNFPPFTTPTTYDGVFRFFFDIPTSLSEIAVWDGDFDYGDFTGLLTRDTDDPDTPNAPFLPPWATADSVSEGEATGLLLSTGNPPDDNDPLAALFLRPPSIYEQLIFPDGQVFTNSNPSGNQEWEQFLISTDPFALADASTPSIPAGTYELRLQGVDLSNLNALRLPAEALCVSEAFEPCEALRPYLVGGTVMTDCSPENNDEPPLEGITLELLDELGNVIGTTVSAPDGFFSFPVEAGTYTVQVADSNFEPGGPLDGYTATLPVSQTAEVINDNVLTYDFGFCAATGSIGDLVWYDINGNGVQDPGEPGIPDVFLELLDGDGNSIDAALTDFNGNYTFVDLPPGTYTVVIDPFSVPPGYSPTYDLDGTATPHTAVVTLGTAQERTDVDFGYNEGVVNNASIGDRVWYDTNGDGIQDPGENGLTGVTVELLDNGGNVINSTVTGANGIYGFNNLAAGSYTVRVVAATLPAGLTPTYDLDGIASAHTAAVTVAAGDNIVVVDFGYRGTASLGDRVWHDANGNGAQDPGENGLTGVTVELLDGDGNVIATTTTGANGIYGFANLNAGTYTVRVVTATLPAGQTPTYDLDGAVTPHTTGVTLTAGQNRDDVDFGYRGTGFLGDRVWSDTNGDGVQDPGETGLTGVTVELLDGDGNVIATTTTGADGIYTFSYLFAGTYTVRVVDSTLPAGSTPTYDLDGIGTPHTAQATLGAGQNRTDVDFGYRGTASLGDRVWYDTNGDGVQDAGENGLTGVTVELLDNGGNVIASTTTGADGIYTFGNLTAGTYTVRVVAATLPAGLAPTYDLDGIATAHTAEATLTAGQNRTDVDFGYRGTASLGDRVWYDTNGNGAQDAGENGLTGVTVELLDNGGNVIATTTTGADGIYTFDNLAAGTYTVRVVASTLPAGVAPTYDLDGIATAHTAEATLTAGQDRTDVDFGYRGTASLGDRVWYDTNGNGAQDAGENGLTGVTVELLDNGGNVIATTTTGADGIYTFDNLAAGTYTVRVVASTLPAGVAPTYDLDGIATAHTAEATLTGGQDRTDVDFGYRGTASLGDRVWYDTNGNGAQDAGENGLTGVTVELLDNGGNVIATTTTGADGIYTFDNLAAGTYTVRVVASTLPAGLAPTYDLDGIATAHTAEATLTGGQDRTDVDFGYRGTASLGDRVWYDANGNAAQDAGENGLTGVTVELLDNGGNVIATTVTGADGIYTFDNLAAGTYTVRVVASTLPAGVAPTYDLDGIATAHTAEATLTGGQDRTDVDFGYRGTASLGDRVWYDANGNAAQDAGENGLTGVTVELLDNGGNVIATTVTGADGIYTFSNLAAGTYTVRVVASTLPAGVAPTYDLDGIATAHTAQATLTGGQNRTDVDFGYRGTASLGDRVWYDTNGNGAQDAGENGLTGVTVELLDNGGNVIATTVTGADGIYTFSNLAAGTYTVRVVSATLPAGSAPTYDLDGIATAHTAQATLTGGQNRTDVDFGYRGTGSLGDRVWYDTNGNGAQDGGENGLTGVTVELLDNGGNVIATTVTGANGIYTFSNLAAGTYTVRVVSATLPAGSAPTYDLDGIATAHTAQATLTGGQNRTDVDFGYRGTGSIGDRVWNDANGNGIQDGGENGLTGVTVELLSGATVIATTTTGANGIYTFSNLAAGSYTVRVVSATLPAGSAPTYDLDGIATAHTAQATLAGGQNRTDVDFGYRGTASIGDRVWYDADGDGVQDGGEAGLTGVTVELLSGATVIATTTTGANGIYTFSNLEAGTYTVRVVSATLPAGSAPTYDLDGIATAHTATATVTGGQNRTDVDFGYRGSASLGDRVWYDTDGDGVQDGGEAGLTGVTVELLSGATVIATTTTGANGIYTFSNLAAGTYTVRVVSATLPAGLAPTYDLDGVATAHTATATVTGGQSRTDVDFGYRGNGSIGDRVWFDADGDGTQDAGETGLTGVTVELLSGATVIATTTTGANGIYTFGNLAAGSYTVRVVSATLPAGVTPTYDLDGIATAHTAAVTLAAGQVRTDVDFGYKGTGSIGDRVWNDVDGDGVQDAGETGYTGVTVELLSGATVIATTTTGANGAYTFSNLAAGSYTVRVVSSTLPAGVVPTYDLDGIASAHTAAATLTAGQNRTDVDFGYRTPPVSCTPGYYKDHFNSASFSNNDGTLTWSGAWIESDSAGAGVSAGNVTVGSPYAGYLFLRDYPDTGTQPSAARQANLSGFTSATLTIYFHVRTAVDPDDAVVVEISNNGGSTYTVIDTLNGYSGTAEDTLTYNLSSAYLVSNFRVRFRVTNGYGSSDELWKLDWIKLEGYCSNNNSSIGDRLWYDTDGDGAQDSGEPGLPGVTVELLNSGGTVIASTTTDSNGIYTFDNLAAGNYTVRVVTSTFPVGGLTPTYDLDGTGTAHTAAVTLAANSDRTDVDFGYRGTRSVGDRVWNDADGDGTQDASEVGINGVTVRLFLGTTEVMSTVTAGNGNYTFTNLPESTFTVRIDTATLPAGMTQTYDLDGTGSAHQATFNLTTSRTDVDFGYRTPPVSCTAGYYKDHFNSASFSNNDGTLNWSGSWIESDTAGAGVSAGNVTVGNPYAGYLFLRDYPDTGTQPSAARQANLSGFTSATLTIYFHVRTGVDPSDAVVVEISNNGGSTYTVLDTLEGYTGTDEDQFSYSIPSAYLVSNFRVRFRVSNGYGSSDELFKLDWIKLEGVCGGPAQQTGSIGNRVWKDTDGDGTQDSGEAGLNGVTVQLLNSSGTVIATTTTAGNGDYTFGSLAAANYSVRVVSSTLPSGLTPSYDLDGTGTAHIAAVTLASGQHRSDVDFGYKTQSTSCTEGYFKDHFNNASFSNNDGTLSWAGSWIESDSAGSGVSSGNVTVGSPYAGYLFLRDYPDTGTQPSAARQANLSGFTSATLSFSFHVRTAVDPDDAVVIEISKNGGSTYTVLDVLDGYTGTDEDTFSYNISSYIASNTRIRFRVSANYGASDELFKLDWVKISGSCN